jgi:motility quorum-sensing regulator/GCU-specific mRNA interferase toxin
MNSPTHNLDAFKMAMARKLRWTGVAQEGAAALGLDEAAVKATIASMSASMFYKTMESEKRPGQMQDVYHVPSRAGLLYVKFTDEGVQEFKLLSFKRK